MSGGHPAGARVVFTRGSVRLDPPVAVPEGAVAAQVSVISPGTELRHLAATSTGPDHPAGYMTVSHTIPPGGERLLAPVPHGAPVARTDAQALRVPAGIAVELVAVARFQLMAGLGLAPVARMLDTAPSVCVVGAGPVALGCVLELHRLGVTEVRVITRHPRPAVEQLPGVTIVPGTARGAAGVVIDCTGQVDVALNAVATGGLLGLLGTPREHTVLSAAQVHRRGLVVVGMHELASDDRPTRQAMFRAVLKSVEADLDRDLVRSWCRTDPGSRAPSVYAELAGPHRPLAPVLLLEWT
ncbi:MAG: hypothetical protein ACRDRE_06240 [Pseudonocardiaceae bacterium]